jgi:hypothetical protein
MNLKTRMAAAQHAGFRLTKRSVNAALTGLSAIVTGSKSSVWRRPQFRMPH